MRMIAFEKEQKLWLFLSGLIRGKQTAKFDECHFTLLFDVCIDLFLSNIRIISALFFTHSCLAQLIRLQINTISLN